MKGGRLHRGGSWAFTLRGVGAPRTPAHMWKLPRPLRGARSLRRVGGEAWGGPERKLGLAAR